MPIRPKIMIVIPVYNEGSVIKDVILSVIQAGYDNIVAVDDGSFDNTWEILQKLPITSVQHIINRGKGAATKTGLEAGLVSGADILVTMDGDGQHESEDIQAVIQPILDKNVDVVLGVRKIDLHEMPLFKKIANYVADKTTYLLYGIHVHDSQSGFRAFSAQAASVIKTRSDAYSYESEVLHEIKRHKLSFCEVPIRARYTAYSTTKLHGQSFTNGLKTLYAMIWNILS
ncbi:MAG: glycosyltransferase family 2 protein [Candidatus Andersenbacteria bacterium]